MSDDDLALARGVVLSRAISSVLWVVMVALVVWWTRS